MDENNLGISCSVKHKIKDFMLKKVSFQSAYQSNKILQYFEHLPARLLVTPN